MARAWSCGLNFSATVRTIRRGNSKLQQNTFLEVKPELINQHVKVALVITTCLPRGGVSAVFLS